MIGALIQARLGSKRLPNKILKKADNKILLDIMINRLRNSKKIDKIIICTTINKRDDKIVKFCKEKKISFYRGSENNVMLRYVNAAKKYKIDTIVRLTSDCPLIDPVIVDKMITSFFKYKTDYLSNTYPPNQSTFPDGTDVEIFKLNSLIEINKTENRKSYREHVTSNFWKDRKYKSSLYKAGTDLSNFRYTLDYKDDYTVLKKIVENFKSRIYDVDTKEIVAFLKKNKKIYLINNHCKNNHFEINEN